MFWFNYMNMMDDIGWLTFGVWSGKGFFVIILRFLLSFLLLFILWCDVCRHAFNEPPTKVVVWDTSAIERVVPQSIMETDGAWAHPQRCGSVF